MSQEHCHKNDEAFKKKSYTKSQTYSRYTRYAYIWNNYAKHKIKKTKTIFEIKKRRNDEPGRITLELICSRYKFTNTSYINNKKKVNKKNLKKPKKNIYKNIEKHLLMIRQAMVWNSTRQYPKWCENNIWPLDRHIDKNCIKPASCYHILCRLHLCPVASVALLCE